MNSGNEQHVLHGGENNQPQTSPNQDSKLSGFDLSKLRLTQNFGAMAGVKKILTTVPVRKPHRQEFVRVRPEPEWQLETAVLELKEDREHYLVSPELWSELPGDLTPKLLLTTINRQGVQFLWPIRLPGEDGKLDAWNMSGMEAAKLAMGSWVRVSANMSLGGYEVFQASGDIPEPEWPETSFQELINIAFKGRMIDSLEHTVIQRLQGLR